MSLGPRKVLRSIPVVLIITLAAAALTTCSGGGGSARKASDVEDVGTVSPAAMAASGVADANVPATFEATMSALPNMGPSSTDPLAIDLQAAITDVQSQLGPKGMKLQPAAAVLGTAVLAFGGMLDKSLGPSAIDQLNRLAADLQNFPTTRSVDEALDLSGNALGNYLMLNKATAHLTASVSTTNNGTLIDTMDNFDSGTGEAAVSLVVESTSLPPGSAIKDLTLKLNAGAALSVGHSTNSSGDVIPANVSFDYGESAVLAVSFNKEGIGGKVVITANAKNSGSIADPQAMGTSHDFSSLVPNMTVTFTVYTDSGAAKFTKTWTDINALITDTGVGGGTGPTGPA